MALFEVQRMPFYLRKSVKVGPLRLNFSKNGIGYSIGIKGLRVGQDARGRGYLHAGRGGVYFRETFPKSANWANADRTTSTDTRVGWPIFAVAAAVATLVLAIALATPIAPASDEREPAVTSVETGVHATQPQQESAVPPSPTHASETMAAGGDQSAELEVALLPQQLSTFQAALVGYEATFDRFGQPLAHQVDRLRTATAPAADPGACIVLLRLIEQFRALALPTPSDEVTFSLTNALARYHEAVVACSLGNDELVRQRLRMGMNLWLRSSTRLTALAGETEPAPTGGPTSVNELFSSIPIADPPAPQAPIRRGGRSPSSGGPRICCKQCVKGQPCGNSCISWRYTCHQPPGCAC